MVETLERVARLHGKPRTIRVDNGPEFICKTLDMWAYLNGVALDFSRPGKPTDNVFTRIVQWHIPGRMPQCFLVPEPGRCTVKM